MEKIKVGAIDLGSNSLRLLIGLLNGKGLFPLHEELRETRLGEKLCPGGPLYPPAQKRTLKALMEYMKIMKDERVEKGVIAATGAVREAADGNAFIEEIGAISSYPVRLLSGREEAFYGFRGAVHGLAAGADAAETIMVLDLGGRSCEFSWQEGGVFKHFSFPFGAVGLHETFLAARPQTDSDFHGLQEHLRQLVPEGQSLAAAATCRELVGLGGTVTTLGAMLCGFRQFESGCVHGYTMGKSQMARMLQNLRYSTPQERQKLLPFAPQRADIITAGTAALLTVLEQLKKEALKVSENGLVHGLLLCFC